MRLIAVLSMFFALASSPSFAARADFPGIWFNQNNNDPISMVRITPAFNLSIDNSGNALVNTFGASNVGTTPDKHMSGTFSVIANGKNYTGTLILGGLLGNLGKDTMALLIFEKKNQPNDNGNVGRSITLKRRIIIVDPIRP